MRVAKLVKRSVVATTLLGLGFVAIVGVAHTPMGRPLLQYLPGMGTQCPIGAELDQVALDDNRRSQLAALRGDHGAPTQSALGLELGTSSRSSVVAWAQAGGLQCTETSDARHQTCSTPDGASTRLSFDVGGKVVAIDRSTLVADAAQAKQLTTDVARELARTLGEPIDRLGSPSGLIRGPLAQARLEYRFADRRTQVVATNLGHGRFRVREVHQAIAGSAS